MSRSRIRVGRDAVYLPTAAEAVAGGGAAGDIWPASITAVNPGGTVNLIVRPPDDTEATADGSDAATTQALANALKATHNATRKVSVTAGATAGTYSVHRRP